ncbi:period circadian protein isoform X2 [Fopius arisanus]|uniref:Period circadian protein n=1 Tax=Fopius arisanus TaxID=64838 RepID=A0A9R1TMV1_9HYME|nr:PREDICTED: period circadian protein isoform X2 [Fopius arisanus]
MSTNDHAKVSDSGYANTCDNSQSQRSSGSSLSRNSNRSGSSGYCGGHPSNFGSSNEALPQPISKKKKKEQKKKKLKTLTSLENEHGDSAQKCPGHQTDTGIYNHISVNSEQVLKKSEEVGTVELVDATEPSEHNGDLKSTIPDRGIPSLTNPLDNSSSNINKEEFYTLVSLHDGLVLHSTNSFQTSLGYPKDSWLGNSFIDLLHLKDRSVFCTKLSDTYCCGEREKDMSEKQVGLFCRIKAYSRENGKEKKDETSWDNLFPGEKRRPLYAPFHLNLGFKYFPEHESGDEKPRMLFLMIIGQPVLSAYKAPEETIISSIFSTRHTATCHLSHVDDDIVRYFGYLPQDMVGQSLFDYYHPEDLPFIKDVYETVVKLKGSSFRSKPYRFAVQNGGYVVLETEWSSFINPWGGKLEFVTGQHRILRGPMNPDVFQHPDKDQDNSLANLSEEVLKESQIIQDEICTLLAETIQQRTDFAAPLLTERRTELISFMENVINEIKGSTITSKLASIAADYDRFSEHDSVMLGEISPHHEYCDSKSSSETPPSYNQLNYNEKIARFFNSKPLANAMYGSDEEIINSSVPSHNDTGKTNSNHTPTKSTANHDSGGSGSGENLSSASNNRTSFGSRDDSVNGNSNSTALENFKLPTLTEGLLNQHNHDMEKLMVLKHKERRSSIKNSKMNKDNRIKSEDQATDQEKTAGKTRGMKRASTHNREEEFFKSSKYDDKTRKCDHAGRNPAGGDKTNVNQQQTKMNMWPQTSVIPPLSISQHYMTASATSHQALRCSPFPHMVPLYYVPMPRIRDYTTTVQSNNQFQIPQHIRPNPYSPYATSPMAGIVYPPVLGAPAPAPMIYAPPMILEVPPVPSENPQPRPVVSPVRRDRTDQRKRPASQATSVKAEPGSIMAMSDSSKKPLSLGGRISSSLSIDGGDSSPVGAQNKKNAAQNSPIESSMEDSSDSSFYGSFLNTSSGSSCNPHPMGLGYSSEKVTPRVPSDPYKIYRPKSWQQVKQISKQRSASWMEGINMTPELIYQYQLSPKSLDDVLKNDMKILNRYPQPLLVNDQLSQLYLDLELEGFESKLILDENSPSSDGNQASATEGSIDVSTQHNRIRCEMIYSKQAMIYEENAPLPPIPVRLT